MHFLAGVTFQGVILASLLRPISFYERFVKSSRTSDNRSLYLMNMEDHVGGAKPVSVSVNIYKTFSL